MVDKKITGQIPLPRKMPKMTIQHSDYKSGSKNTGLDSDKPGFKYQLQYLRQSY